MNKVGERLRSLRGDRTLDVVAKEIGVTRDAISKYEMGQRVPKDAIKVKLARYYQTTVEDLFYA